MIVTTMPFLQRLVYALVAVSSIAGFIYIGQDIIVPFAFAVLLSVLLLPANKFLERKKVPRVIAIMLTLTFSIIFIATLIYFLASQIGSFIDDIPAIKKQLQVHFKSLQSWLYQQFSITRSSQTQFLNDAAEKFKDGGQGFLSQSISTATQSVLVLILLPVYSFLLLYYRDMIRKFLIDVFDGKDESKVKDVLIESRVIVQSYMIGLLIELGIVAVINSSGFFILGIKYAIFLGVFAAILNLIPYIGMLIASVFCMLITLTTSTHISDVFWVGVILTIVQFIDNNIIMPKVVSSKVKINALLSIIGVLIGGALAGVSGMFLSIPALAILKAIFDRVENLKPWGMLLGDEITGTSKKIILKKIIGLKK